MPQPRKRTRVYYITPDGKRTNRHDPSGVKTPVESDLYYGRIGGKYVPLSRNLEAARRILTRKLAEADLAKAGIAPPTPPVPVTVGMAMADYRSHLRLKGDTEQHVDDTAARVLAVFAFASPLLSLDASVASRALLAMQHDGEPIQLPNRSEFTPAQAREILDVSKTSTHRTVMRLGLAATGNGRARRYPRATVQAMLEAQARGISPETANHYVRSLRAFGKWLEETGRLPKNPFRTLALAGTASDRRHDRRALDADEMRRLLAAAESSPDTRAGLSGADRRMVYLLAYCTGWRASALAGVTPGDFRLDADPPTVLMPARRDKSRKGKRQAVSPEAAMLFRDYLEGHEPDERLWPGWWHRKAAEILRFDLRDAGIPYAVPGPDGPLYADFHALRHSCLTALGKVPGVSLRTVQEVAGHSTPVLTARYMRSDIGDQAAGVAGMPEVTR